MSEFDYFNQAVAIYTKDIKEEQVSPLKIVNEKKNDCKNHSFVKVGDTHQCYECGVQESLLTSEKEWRFYGKSDGRHVSDPTRVKQRKNDDRTIYKDVQNMGFSDKIVSSANKIYLQVTDGKIFRGNSRKSIIFACIFHAYKLSGTPHSHDKLIGVFKLNRKNGLKGLKHVNLNAPKFSEIRTTYITPSDLVSEIMDKFSANSFQKQEVCDLYEDIKNKSSRLNRSRPQSVSAGLVYYWIKKKRLDISIKDFTKSVNLSELTISKIAKEIESILSPKKKFFFQEKLVV